MAEHDRVGLCAGCVHASRVRTPRAEYWRCGLAGADPRFERYPRLPILACPGFQPGVPRLGPGPRAAADEPQGPPGEGSA